MVYTVETKSIQNYLQCSITFDNASTIVNAALVRSILKSAPHLCNPIIHPQFKKLQFLCHHSFIPLHQHITKTTLFHSLPIHKIIFDITQQVKHLVEEEKKSFLGFHPNHVYVIDGNQFIYLSGEYIGNLFWDHPSRCKFISIEEPIRCNDFFLSPEQWNLTSLPARVDYRCCFYSLATLFAYIYILQRKWALRSLEKLSIQEEEEEIDDDHRSSHEMSCRGVELVSFSKEYESFQLLCQTQLNTKSANVIHLLSTFPIYNTKLFYFLKRCLCPVAKERTIVFI